MAFNESEYFGEHRKFLEDRIEPNFGLIDQLRSAKVLSSRELQSIKKEKVPFKRNSFILNAIAEKKEIKVLYSALRATSQSHIVNYLEGNGVYSNKYMEDWPLNELQLDILDTNWEYLVDHLQLEPDLVPELHSRNVINKRQKEKIKSIKETYAKAETFLEYLKLRSNIDYGKTITSLETTNQGHIATILLEGKIELGEITEPISNNDQELVPISSVTKNDEKTFQIWCKLGDNWMALSAQLNYTLSLRLVLIMLRYIHSHATSVQMCSSIEENMEQLVQATISLQSGDHIEESKLDFLNTKMDDLPVEVIQIILRKSVFLALLMKDNTSDKQDKEILEILGSVSFFWFQFIANQSKKHVWKQLAKYYSRKSSSYSVYSSNRQFIQENVCLGRNLMKAMKSNYFVSAIQNRPIGAKKRPKGPKGTHLWVEHIVRKRNDESELDNFVQCLFRNRMTSTAKLLNDGGVAIRVELEQLGRLWIHRHGLKQLTLRDTNQLRADAMLREVIKLRKDNDLEILNAAEDRELVVWIWCKSQNALKNVKQMNENKSLGDILGPSIFAKMSRQPKLNCDQLEKYVTAIDKDVIASFVKRLAVDFEEEVRGVTKLKHKIYVISRKIRYSSSIYVFDDKTPFACLKKIENLQIKDALEIGSCESENCLYVIDILENCLWKIKQEDAEDDQEENAPEKVLTFDEDFSPKTLSVSSDGQLLMVSHDPPFCLRTYWLKNGSYQYFTTPLSNEIETCIHAVEASNANFIVLYKSKIKHPMTTKGKGQNELFLVGEMDREGNSISRRFLSEQIGQSLGRPSHLTVDSEDRVFLADTLNERVILLTSNLKRYQILIPKNYESDTEDGKTTSIAPKKLFYDEESGLLIIGGYKEHVDIYKLK